MDDCHLVGQAIRCLLAAVCVLALGSVARCADEPNTEPDITDEQWQYAGDDESWISPVPQDVPPPGRMFSGLPQHPLRHMGFGKPLVGTSWMNRPYYIGAFGGTWLGDESLIGGQVNQGSGFFGGYWLGADLNHYWGSELRVSLFYVNTSFPGTGLSGAESRNIVTDLNLMYYPWGDARWRPYGSIGLGLASYHFVDPESNAVNHTGVQLPIGFGVKYLCHKWLALRLDIKDNIVFGGNRVDTTGNWSFLGGIEVHWGSKSSLRYFPW